MTSLADGYLVAAGSAIDLLAHPAVGLRWDEPSALPGFTVSGLAGHLALQVLGAGAVLGAPAGPEVEVRTLEEHYGGVRWRGAAVDEPANVAIREVSEQRALVGPAALVTEVRAELDRLRPLLAAGGGPVLIATHGWALTRDDYLVTRTMEIAVHSDDLAVSVGVDTPALPVQVMHPVFDLLFVLSLRRHGYTAMLRALSRAERAPTTIAAL
jgi:Mycothiol maleylpyruvate isomerase N-terminal domain